MGILSSSTVFITFITQTVKVESMGGAGTDVIVMVLEDLRRLMVEDKKEAMDTNHGADQVHDPRKDKLLIHLVVVDYRSKTTLIYSLSSLRNCSLN